MIQQLELTFRVLADGLKPTHPLACMVDILGSVVMRISSEARVSSALPM